MKPGRIHTAFTLVELLVVITIIGALAAMSMPMLSQFRKGDAMLAASRQMMDAVARARSLAISQRTTVYMVFLPNAFWTNSFDVATRRPMDMIAATNLADNVLASYAFVAMRTVGDQPGQGVPRYLSTLETLPESILIATNKFVPRNNYFTIVRTNSNRPNLTIYGFEVTDRIPFPFFDTPKPFPLLPFIAFDYTGRLVSGQDEYIPLAQGGVLVRRNRTVPMLFDGSADVPVLPSVKESPPGNSTNAYNVVHVDWLTGRARIERREIQ